MPLEPDGSFDSTSTTYPAVKAKFDEWMTEDVTSVTITIENTEGGEVPVVVQEISFCYSHSKYGNTEGGRGPCSGTRGLSLLQSQ